MKKFFNTIIGFFEVIFDFLTNIIDSFINFAEVLHTSLALPRNLVGLMPGILTTAVITIVACGVVKVLLGR